VRKIPILIGGSGPKRTLPAVARHADIWHTFLSVEAFAETSARVDELAAAMGRDRNDIERSVHWLGAESAGAYLQAGATTFINEIAPDPISGYDFGTLEEMLAWRDHQKCGLVAAR
jgi:alkanesulfonate monooxygenase SsuD/methylene tetrahydromethanopterin reductase-like flavin-dependent oxidoreductase (luciferase family)